MCKVVRYTFNCGHHLKLQTSQCRGKFHREKRGGKRAACCAEPYLTTKFSYNCGECEQTEWEDAWRERLDRARRFLAGLAGLPGRDQVLEEIKNLESEYSRDAWNLRQKFPPIHKKLIGRVAPGGARGTSKLRIELQPEEISLDGKTNEIEAEEDEDTLESTDPFHPITLDYSHPLDNSDNSWVEEYLAQKEAEIPQAPNMGFEPEPDTWSFWNKHISEDHLDNGTNTDGPGVSHAPSLMAWGLDAENPASSNSIGMNGLRTEDSKPTGEQVEDVLRAFWNAVNGSATQPQNTLQSEGLRPVQPDLNGPLHLALQDFTICQGKNKSERTNCGALTSFDSTRDTVNLCTNHDKGKLSDVSPDANSYANDIAPRPANRHVRSKIPSAKPVEESPPPTWTDGACNMANSSIEALDSSKPRRSTSKFDKQRDHLHSLRHSDPTRFYGLWLKICRYEIRHRQGIDGRQIPDPENLKPGETTSGMVID